jgi:hypothetical protein
MASEAQISSREINLPAYKAAVIYVPKGASTIIEKPLEIGPFLQNKANLHFTAENTENLATKTQRREDKKKTYIINLGVLAPWWR